MKALAILIAMAATLGTCDVFRCYSCSGLKDGWCGESFTASYTVYCNTACYKSISSQTIFTGLSTTYSRGCYSTTHSMTCDKNAFGFAGIGADAEKCYCGSDLCNSASSMLPSIVQIVMVVAAAFFFQKF